jgi:hypothetical protein
MALDGGVVGGDRDDLRRLAQAVELERGIERVPLARVVARARLTRGVIDMLGERSANCRRLDTQEAPRLRVADRRRKLRRGEQPLHLGFGNRTGIEMAYVAPPDQQRFEVGSWHRLAI